MNGFKEEMAQVSFCAFCGIRDVVEAPLQPYQNDEAADRRFIVTGGNYSYHMKFGNETPEGKGGSGIAADVYKVDNSRAKRVLGLTLRSLGKCNADTARSLLKIEKAEKARIA